MQKHIELIKQSSALEKSDNAVYLLIDNEYHRQNDQIELIASENIVSRAVLEAQGSVLTNKYAEGYPSKRYYGGCRYVDIIETLAIERAKKLFKCSYANVQPHSGTQANQSVMLALLQPGDTILGMGLSSGGHLTHGARVNLSGKWFNSITYGVSEATMEIDYNDVEQKAIQHHPKLIIAGTSAYSRNIDYKIFRDIADKVGAYLMADMAHVAGLVATGFYNDPLPYAHVVTSTTHKTLRGPRGGIVLSNDNSIAKKINSAIFPGLQGGPLIHVIAAKAVAFHEALQPSFKTYIKAVIENAQTMTSRLMKHGYKILTNGTDTHLLLFDLRPLNLEGAVVENFLENCDIACNKNSIPFDTAKPTNPSGIRLGTPACTTRGFRKMEFEEVADIIHESIQCLIDKKSSMEDIKKRVKNLCIKFPIYCPPLSVK